MLRDEEIAHPQSDKRDCEVVIECIERQCEMGIILDSISIRRYQAMDQEKIIELAKRNLMEININDYPFDLMEKFSASYTPNHIDHLASNGHMYVVEIHRQVVGCGTIMPFWRKEDQSMLMSIYALPEMHGRGIGRFIMAALESDEFYMRARRIEIPATFTAVGFYEKFGYRLIGGRKQPDEEGSYHMEKIRKVRI